MKLLTCIWLLAVGVGFYALNEYGSTPGDAGTPVSHWPGESRIVRAPGRPTLVLALHPHCPCSRATIDALAHVMTRCRGSVTAHVLFHKPADFPDNWEKTDLWYSAARIPEVTVLCDDDGFEAKCFGAQTSGQAALYDAEGALLFRGGVTASRGHQGDSPGLESLISCLSQGTPDRAPRPVFGCPLGNPEGTPR